MRTFRAPGETRKYRIKEEDYLTLLQRFNPYNAVGGFDIVRINLPCICSRYSACNKCPLCHKGLSCMSLLGRVMLNKQYIHLTGYTIWWRADVDKEAREEVQKIQEWILSWEKEQK